jgi:Lrp/AsnC family leucine-responsive transcriptional regulator
MDAIDCQIVEFLAKDGRIPYAQIAARIGKSTATVHQRVRRLRERGYLTGVTLNLNWEALGYPLEAYISIRDSESQGMEALADSLRSIPFVVSASAVTGEFDLLLQIRARSSSHLGEVLDDIRRVASGSSRTLVTLSTYFSGRIPPLPAPEPQRPAK